MSLVCWEILHNSATKNDADIAICNYRRFDTVTKEYSQKTLTHPNTPSKVCCADDIPALVFNAFGGITWNKLYKREFLKDNGLTFTQDLVLGADSVFVHESLLHAKKIIYTDQCLISYRVNNPGSDIGRAASFLPDIVSTINKLYEIVRKQKNPEKFLRSLDNWVVRKCVWIYELNGSRVDPLLASVLQKHNLAQHSDDYYYFPSAARQKMMDVYNQRQRS